MVAHLTFSPPYPLSLVHLLTVHIRSIRLRRRTSFRDLLTKYIIYYYIRVRALALSSLYTKASVGHAQVSILAVLLAIGSRYLYASARDSPDSAAGSKFFLPHLPSMDMGCVGPGPPRADA